ncbi:hypothetical protein [Streptomyces sp. NPDC017988]|uniref:hypothetical protein n=1 Tax=Streptomyces sp. NPDC017988 TaxID=3365025 RepID=UPI0037BB4281
MKAFPDLLPQHAFPGKPVPPLATGGSPAPVLALGYAPRPVLTALGAHVCQGRFLLDRHITPTTDGAMTPDHDDERQLGRRIGQFARAPPRPHPAAA